MAVITNTYLSDISSYRLDAEYYNPSQLSLHNQLLKSDNKSLISIAKVNGGKRLPKGEGFIEEGFPYVRVVDINNGFVSDEKVAYPSNNCW